ncbi:hypothetical protein GGTG_00149 [Gaeumannomyces tritici R3-111a-1]|uniref:Uncharacterized protein n=1 Tax=Gaeumannomyces tritici (strain R3-111a-1) TaxID=644352 RepID=J3NFV5_GAET3|nr:hypothetical protein GGTG_00149 [Gaeumannomyces tritici R3-111a-1]EJT80145.1 hypothetical protein GGTG_00149 [Gaeumannomyces tritici R3-111a-1]
MATADVTMPKRPERASFRISYWVYIDPSNARLYSENLARILNWPRRHGKYRPFESPAARHMAAAPGHHSLEHQTDLIPLQIDAVGVPIPIPAATTTAAASSKKPSSSGSSAAAGLAEHKAVRDFCADTCASLQDPCVMKLVFRPHSAASGSRRPQTPAPAHVPPPPWTHIKIERTDVPISDPYYYCAYYLPPTSRSVPWCQRDDELEQRPGMRAFRTLTEMAESCLATGPDYEPSFYKGKISIHDKAAASVLHDFTRTGRRTKTQMEEICSGDGPNGIEVSETLLALSQAMQNITALFSKKHDDHFRPSITYKLSRRFNLGGFGAKRHHLRREFEEHLSQVRQSMTAAAAPLRTVAIMARLSGPYGSFYGLTGLCPKDCTAAEEGAVLALIWGWYRGCDDVPALIPAGVDPVAVGRDSLRRAAAHWHDAHETARVHLRQLVCMWGELEDKVRSSSMGGGWAGVREKRFGRREMTPERNEVEAISGLGTGALMQLLRTPPPPPPPPPPQTGSTSDSSRRRGRNRRRRGRVFGTYSPNPHDGGCGLAGIKEDQWLANGGTKARFVDATPGRLKSGLTPVPRSQAARRVGG